MIELQDIKRTFGKGATQVHALRGVDLKISDGEMIAIMGPSGCGKTTLLNIVGCIDKPTSGEYFLDESDITQYSVSELSRLRNQKFGFIVQDFALIDDYTVYQNVILPIRYSKNKTEKEVKKSVFELLEKLGISDKIKEYPVNLSGGQKQRVAIARALINRPEIILADEPTGALDQKNGQEIMQLFKNINECGQTIVIVTHDLNIAKQCDRIIEMVDGVIVS